MSCRLEYHGRVQRWVPASVAAFAVMAFCVTCVSAGAAQANGAPASVASQGSGRAFSGAAPGVTSFSQSNQSQSGLGQNGTAGTRVTFSPGSGHSADNGDHHPHHSGGGHEGYVGPVWYAVPYAVDVDSQEAEDQDDSQANDDADYQGGPTVFDRRGSGADSYIPPVKNVPQPHAANTNVQAETPQLPTTLMFKDGHEMEVGNYAVVGQTLYDLTPGHARRIALADLDLEATRKVNDDHGVVFDVPSSPQAN